MLSFLRNTLISRSFSLVLFALSPSSKTLLQCRRSRVIPLRTARLFFFFLRRHLGRRGGALVGAQSWGTAEEVAWLPGRLRVHSRCSGVSGESIKKLYQETRARIRVLEGSVGSPDRIGNDAGTRYRSGIYLYTPELEKMTEELWRDIGRS